MSKTYTLSPLSKLHTTIQLFLVSRSYLDVFTYFGPQDFLQ